MVQLKPKTMYRAGSFIQTQMKHQHRERVSSQRLECGHKVPPPSISVVLSFASGSVVLIAYKHNEKFITQTLSSTMQIKECQNKVHAPFRLFCKRRR